MAETAEGKTYTDDQINAIVNERLDKDRKSRGWSEADAEELKNHRKAAKDKEVEDAKSRKEFDKALELKDQQHAEALRKERERGDGIEGRYKRERIHNALLAAASSAINPEQVATLLGNRVSVDEDYRPIVLDANGKPVNGVTVSKLVADFLAENKHFVSAASAGQSNGTAGAGGSSGSDRGGGDTGPLGDMAKAKAELEAAEKAGDGQRVLKANTKFLAAQKRARDAGLLT